MVSPGLSGELPSSEEIIAELQGQVATYEQELQLNKTFVDECPMALIAIDMETKKICLWNKYAVSIFGYTENEALGSGLDLIIPANMISMIEHGAKLDNYITNDRRPKGMGGGREFQAKTKDGHLVEIDIKVFPVPLGDDVYLIGAAAEDVTIMRRTIRELSESNEAAGKLRAQLKQKLQNSEQEKVKLIEVNSKAKIENLLVKIYAWSVAGTMSLLVIFGIGPMLLNLFKLVPDDMSQTAAIAVQGLLQVIAGQVAGGAGVAIGKSQSGDGNAATNTSTSKTTTETVYAPSEHENTDFPTTYPQP